MLLADAGASVLRVNRPGPAAERPERDLLNRGRRSAVLDLKHPRAIEALLQLSERADVLIEGYRPGVTERLGVGPDACLARNPRLVYARMTGWGQDGPLASTVGHDIGYIARTGALHALGRAGGPPQFPANLLGDFGGGGMLMAYGICAALVERATSGRGQVVDAAIVDGVANLLAMPLDVPGPGPVAGRARGQPARRRRALVRRLPDQRRPVDGRRRPGTPVLRRAHRGSRPARIPPTAATRATGPSCGSCSRPVRRTDPGPVDQDLRGQRGVRGARSVVARGRAGPAPDRPADLRGAWTGSPSRPRRPGFPAPRAS